MIQKIPEKYSIACIDCVSRHVEELVSSQEGEEKKSQNQESQFLLMEKSLLSFFFQ